MTPVWHCHRMTQAEFQREWLGEFQEDPFIPLAMEYHERCEAYDRTVCSASRNGVAVPVDGREFSLVSLNARDIRVSIFDREFPSAGCDIEEWWSRFHAAIRHCSDFDKRKRV